MGPVGPPAALGGGFFRGHEAPAERFRAQITPAIRVGKRARGGKKSPRSRVGPASGPAPGLLDPAPRRQGGGLAAVEGPSSTREGAFAYCAGHPFPFTGCDWSPAGQAGPARSRGADGRDPGSAPEPIPVAHASRASTRAVGPRAGGQTWPSDPWDGFCILAYPGRSGVPLHCEVVRPSTVREAGPGRGRV